MRDDVPERISEDFEVRPDELLDGEQPLHDHGSRAAWPAATEVDVVGEAGVGGILDRLRHGGSLTGRGRAGYRVTRSRSAMRAAYRSRVGSTFSAGAAGRSKTTSVTPSVS